MVYEVMNSFENRVDSFVLMTSFPPALDDTGVVSVYDEVVASARESGEGVDQ
jgi:hypothetical protein